MNNTQEDVVVSEDSVTEEAITVPEEDFTAPEIVSPLIETNGTVAIIDEETNTTSTLDVGPDTGGIAVGPDGTRACN